MRSLILFFCMFVLSGCMAAKSPYKGGEVLLVPQSHHFSVKVRNNQWKQAFSELEGMVAPLGIERENVTLRLSLSADTPGWFTGKARKHFLAMGSAPARIHIADDLPGHASFHLRIVRFRVETENCQPYQFGRDDGDLGCFTDSMRMKQAAYPQHLLSTKER